MVLAEICPLFVCIRKRLMHSLVLRLRALVCSFCPRSFCETWPFTSRKATNGDAEGSQPLGRKWPLDVPNGICDLMIIYYSHEKPHFFALY